jgi:hypothetical protein
MSAKYGTTSMIGHLDKACAASLLVRLQQTDDGQGQHQLSQGAGATAAGVAAAPPPPPPHLQGFLTGKLAEFVAEGLCSIELATGAAMQKLLQGVVDMAQSVRSRVIVKDILPSAQTVRRSIVEKTRVARADVVVATKQAIQEKRCGATTDMWTDDHRHYHYICVTVSFNNIKWERENYPLLTVKYPVDQKTTADNVREILESDLETIGITRDEFRGIDWTTDQGSNIRKALEDVNRDDCLAHLLNTVLRNTLTLGFQELRLQSVGASAGAKSVLEPYVEVAKVVKASTGSFNFNLVKLKENVKPASPHRASYSLTVQSIITHKPKVRSTYFLDAYFSFLFFPLAFFAILFCFERISGLNNGYGSDGDIEGCLP